MRESTLLPLRNRIVPLTDGPTQIWDLDLGLTADELGMAWNLLDPAERTAVKRFATTELQLRYAARHALLRIILSDATGIPPKELRFGAGEFGKPSLDMDNPPIHFNLSHRGYRALVGVNTEHEVGVDLEVVQSFPVMESVAKRHFSNREMAIWDPSSSEERVKLFYFWWTRKEAVLKAMGWGLTADSRRMDVMDSAEGGPALWDGDPMGVVVVDLNVEPGFAGAVALRHEECNSREY